MSRLTYYLGYRFLSLSVRMLSKKRKQLVWGPVPILNNKYWSLAMQSVGYDSLTLMHGFYPPINKESDYDMYFEDCIPKWIRPEFIRKMLLPYRKYFAFFYIVRNASVLHMPFTGGPLGDTPYWRKEAKLFRRAGIKTILLSYGSDAYMYSQVIDPSARNGLLISNPDAGRTEAVIRERVQYWTTHADIVLAGLMIDGMSRWDCPVSNKLCINTEQWSPKKKNSENDGHNGPVRVMHTPNHRGTKGTEFLLHAVEALTSEGLQIELVLLEKMSNDEVRSLMQEVDILAEQFILTGYGLSGVEGMASGLPVMSNLENETHTRIFRRYSFLNECPILSTTPENIKKHLSLLITNPDLRKQLGRAGRKYVEKYHSYQTAQYLFGSIYQKILNGKDVDLMNLFHPLLSPYNNNKPYVSHPLVDNKLPEDYLEKVK